MLLHLSRVTRPISALAPRVQWTRAAAPPRGLRTRIAGDATFTASTVEQPAVRGDTNAHDAFLPFESPIYARFVNLIMYEGKKQTARKLLWSTFTRLRDLGHDPQDVFHDALDNVRPLMELRTFKAGPVPFPLNPTRAEGQAMKWIVKAARDRSGTATFDSKLAQELLAAQQHKGVAVSKREQVHKMAVANQAAAHFRWRIGGSKAAGALDMDRKQYRPQGRRAVKRSQGSLPWSPPRVSE